MNKQERLEQFVERMDTAAEELLDKLSVEGRKSLDTQSDLFQVISEFIGWVEENDIVAVDVEMLETLQAVSIDAMRGMEEVCHTIESDEPADINAILQRFKEGLNNSVLEHNQLLTEEEFSDRLLEHIAETQRAIGENVSITTQGSVFLASKSQHIVTYNGATPFEALDNLRLACQPPVDSMDEDSCHEEVKRMLPDVFTAPYVRRTHECKWRIATRNSDKRYGGYLLEWFLSDPEGDSISAWRSAVEWGRKGWYHLEFGKDE